MQRKAYKPVQLHHVSVMNSSLWQLGTRLSARSRHAVPAVTERTNSEVERTERERQAVNDGDANRSGWKIVGKEAESEFL